MSASGRPVVMPRRSIAGLVADAQTRAEPTAADLGEVTCGDRHFGGVAVVDRLDAGPERDRRGDVGQRAAQCEVAVDAGLARPANPVRSASAATSSSAVRLVGVPMTESAGRRSIAARYRRPSADSEPVRIDATTGRGQQGRPHRSDAGGPDQRRWRRSEHVADDVDDEVGLVDPSGHLHLALGIDGDGGIGTDDGAGLEPVRRRRGGLHRECVRVQLQEAGAHGVGDGEAHHRSGGAGRHGETVAPAPFGAGRQTDRRGSHPAASGRRCRSESRRRARARRATGCCPTASCPRPAGHGLRRRGSRRCARSRRIRPARRRSRRRAPGGGAHADDVGVGAVRVTSTAPDAPATPRWMWAIVAVAMPATRRSAQTSPVTGSMVMAAAPVPSVSPGPGTSVEPFSSAVNGRATACAAAPDPAVFRALPLTDPGRTQSGAESEHADPERGTCADDWAGRSGAGLCCGCRHVDDLPFGRGTLTARCRPVGTHSRRRPNQPTGSRRVGCGRWGLFASGWCARTACRCPAACRPR